MKHTLKLALVALAALLLTSCALLPPEVAEGDAENVDWPKAVQCVADDIPDIISEVSQVLLKGGTEKDWTDLARRKGPEAIGDLLCATEQIVHDWSAPGAATSPEAIRGLENAQKYLAATGTKIER